MVTARGWRACRNLLLRRSTYWRRGHAFFLNVWMRHYFLESAAQDLIFGRKYDNILKATCKGSTVAEAVLEHETVLSEWNKILALLKNEEIERKTAQGQSAENDDGAGEPCELELLRTPPQQHSEGSESYWKAVANQTVRTYCCFNPEPKTLQGMITWTSSVLQGFQGEVGQTCVLTHLDLDALGESFGPSQQPLLRKRFNPDIALLRTLVQGSMIGRNAQRKGDEATCPAEGELLMVHAGFDRTSKEVESLFRVSTARKDAALDAEQKELMIVFTDKSIRSRKKKIRGSYTTRSVANLFSAVPFSNLLPEKAYSEFGGHNTGDVFFGVSALQPEELLCLSRTIFFLHVTFFLAVTIQLRHI